MAAINIRVKGKKNVIKNFNRAINKIEGRTEAGLLTAATFIQGESDEITPRELGNLQGSSFVDVEMTSKGPVARIGHEAEYAAFVHEMPKTNNFTTPGTGPKFLWLAVTRNTKAIIEIIRRRAKF